MKERPILFNAPMVRALLDGSKTQTRRIPKPRKSSLLIEGLWTDDYVLDPGNHSALMDECPYGQPGDRLWVREAWRSDSMFDAWKPSLLGPAALIFHEADNSLSGLRGLSHAGKLRPGMFMPRWASRITLEITGVRAERLQNIGPSDCKAEGVKRLPLQEDALSPWYTADVSAGTKLHSRSAIGAYHKLWETINAKSRPTLPHNTASKRYARVKKWLDTHPDTTSWDANPWVWVIDFKRIPQPKAHP